MRLPAGLAGCWEPPAKNDDGHPSLSIWVIHTTLLYQLYLLYGTFFVHNPNTILTSIMEESLETFRALDPVVSDKS